MRHFRSILYAVVLAPAVWILAAVGFTQDLTTRGRDDFAVESVGGLSLLVLAGAAYAILLLSPISPAGPLLAGLALGGMSVWALVEPSGYAALWPANVAKDGFDLSRPGYGLAAMLAIPLMCTALSARRWERYEPPVLPLIGQIGRFRATAPAPTIPAAVLETTVLRSASSDPDPTTVLRSATSDPDPTTVIRVGPQPPRTTAVDVPGSDPTVVISNDPTLDTTQPEAKAPSRGDDPTAAVRDNTEPTLNTTPPETDAATATIEADEPTATPTGDEPTAVPASDEPTVVTASDEPTVGGEPATETGQVVKAPAARPLHVEAEATTYLSGERDVESTLSRLIAPTPRETGVVVSSDEAATIASLGRPAGGDSTQVIRLSEPEPSSSIADAEQPDISDDPTSRIVPPSPRAGEPEKREMTVMSMERPPDDIPTQRRPTDD
ncbi:hypothetical protein ACQP2X_04935 [Actinoplanes sp. CA-131856]